MYRLILLVALLVLSISLLAGTYSSAPQNPQTDDKYLFYLRGSVEYSEGETEKYEMAIDEISSGPAHVISEVRGNTEPNSYALELKKQIDHLLAKGVPAKHITINGFSKGAVIAPWQPRR
jgi:hypothetical protein